MRAVARAGRLRRELSASHHIPYLAQVSDHLVTTAHGDVVQVFQLDGASFECADDVELNRWHERLNLLLRNLSTPNFALWTHLIRRRADSEAPRVLGAGFAAQLEQRYQSRLAGETLMVNEWYLSVVFRPVIGSASSLLARLLEWRSPETQLTGSDVREACEKLAQTLKAALARYAPERLGIFELSGRRFSRVLEFFALLINGEQVRVPMPRASLQDVLATTRSLFGTEVIEYRTPSATHFGAMLGIKEYPTPTTVGMFDALLRAPFPFVLTQSFTFLSKTAGQTLLQRQQARMANAGDYAVSQAEELVEALDALTGNEFVMGDHHLTLQVREEERSGSGSVPPARRIARLTESVALARTLLADTGMSVAREDLALEAAFWAQLPGNFSYRPRKSPITSRNFAAMSNFHNYAVGRKSGNHWGEALLTLVTRAQSPHHFSLHASSAESAASRRDTGHTFLCGPTGSGKTVFIGLLVCVLARRGITQVVFDKDQGLEILVRALDGEYWPLRNGHPTGFNPLQLPDSPESLEFQKIWLRSLVQGPTPLSVREEADLDHALHGTRSLDPERRRLSRLIEFTDATRSEGLCGRLARWCGRGDYAWVFDNEKDALIDRLSGQALIGFDVTDFLDHAFLRGPVTLYLFHCIRQLLDGRRFVCWTDEFSRLLTDERFEQFAKDGLKVWRKLDGVFCAATQSPSDALQSSISRTIIEQTATKVFFPNPEADVSEYMNGFGLTEREVALIRNHLEPGGRQFLIKQGHDSVVCELDLKGFDSELVVLSGRAREIERLHQLMRQRGPRAADWLADFQRGIGEHPRN